MLDNRISCAYSFAAMKYLVGVLAALIAFSSKGDVPAFHDAAPAKDAALPPIVSQSELVNSKLTKASQLESYNAADKIGDVLYQLPCYCHCDRHGGHTSLRSCFEGKHGAECQLCQAEALYAYSKSREGWSAAQIRDGIIKGEFKNIDLKHPEPVQ